MESIPAQPPSVIPPILAGQRSLGPPRRILAVVLVALFIVALLGGFFVFQWWNSPQRQLEKAVNDYKVLDLRSVAGGLYIDTFLSVRDGLINRALQANAALASGDQTKALDELEALKKRIEVQSRGDERSITEVAMDKNNNGITDYLEPFYEMIVKIIARLK